MIAILVVEADVKLNKIVYSRIFLRINNFLTIP
jgi:hypothetical protein